MASTLQILTIPIAMESPVGDLPTLYLTEVDLEADPPDPEDKNDVQVLFVFDEDVSSFDTDNVLLSAVDDRNRDISSEVQWIGNFIGKGSVFQGTIRFPGSGDSGSVTFTVENRSHNSGSEIPSTTETIAYSDDFPDSVWLPLFRAIYYVNRLTGSETDYDQIVSID